MNNTSTMTGIPIEWMFGALGTLVAVVYADLKYSVRSLQYGAVNRDRILTLICDRLKIVFNPSEK